MIPDSITDPSSDHRVRSSGEDVHGSAFVVVNPAIAAKQPDGRALRRQAFVDAARDAFFADGYGQTAMSAIASAVGGSKTTLWSYFPSKQDLFAAVVDDIVDQYSSVWMIELDPAGPIEPTLRRFATAMMATILSESIVALHRVVMGEAQRFPELGAMFYERGPQRGRARLATYIGAAMDDGRLRPGDPMVAARQFASMCKSGCFQEMLLGIEGFRNPGSVAQDIDDAIDSFMRAWGAPR
ncbi:TetR/AcrR family transcriptional regulator [Sphingomonas alpina]|uniref:TetR/AcrR family transcriptional regulator n=1 Tax=Sphingomonas alpina TaxID=653931 RepID=A0A7H0LEW5_9SPHN|nr:TetR/AcrR family transcriptional regulator [Sphingomonas alpina]